MQPISHYNTEVNREEYQPTTDSRIESRLLPAVLMASRNAFTHWSRNSALDAVFQTTQVKLSKEQYSL